MGFGLSPCSSSFKGQVVHGLPLNLFLGVVHIDEKKRVDWNAIRAEYIGGGISTRKLADKYGVKYHTLRDRAISDDWTRLRDEASSKCIALTEQSIAEAVADNATANERCRAKVYELFEMCADNMKRSGHITAQSVRHLSAALKDLQSDEPKQVDVEDLSPLVELLKL